MAWTGDPFWLADVLRAEGLKVIEHDGWKDRGHGDFLDVRGVLCHHTAGGGPRDWEIVQNGRSDLPGPLAQLVLERDGTFRVIAVGVCWHAGRGSWPGWPTNNANFHTIGIEAVNNGVGQDWPAVQVDAYKRGCAAILRRIGRRADDCAGHKEYSTEGKIDPAGIDMNVFRRDVQAIIDRKVEVMGAAEDNQVQLRGPDMKGWPARRYHETPASQPKLSVVDFVREIDAKTSSKLSLDNRPVDPAVRDDMFGHVLSMRAELAQLRALVEKIAGAK